MMPSFIFTRAITGVLLGSRGRARNFFVACCVLFVAFGYISFWSGWISHIRHRLRDPSPKQPKDRLDDTAEDRRDTSGSRNDNRPIDGRETPTERHEITAGEPVIQNAEPLIQI